MNETYYVKTEEKQHTVKIQNEDEKFYAYDAEIVDNPTGTLVEKTITQNGEYLPSDDNADGYSKVTVNVPVPINRLVQFANGSLLDITADDLIGLTILCRSAFYGCARLTSIVLPNTVTEIGQTALYNCSGLNSITILATTPPILANINALTNTDCPIYVPAASVDTYKAATNWSQYALYIQAIPE